MFTSTQQDEHGEAKIRRSRRKGAGRGSMYRGVRMRKWGRWVSEIRMPDKRGRIWLGSYESPRKAALAYDFAEFHLRGPRARLNFPDTPPSPRQHHLQCPRQIQAGASHFANQHAAAAAAFSTGSGSRAAKEAQSAHRSAAYVAATLSEGCCVTSRSAAYVVDTLSEGCCVSGGGGSSDDDSVVSEAAVVDYEGKGKLAELQLDEAVLDSLRKFLADHSHTDWWLAS